MELMFLVYKYFVKYIELEYSAVYSTTTSH